MEPPHKAKVAIVGEGFHRELTFDLSPQAVSGRAFWQLTVGQQKSAAPMIVNGQRLVRMLVALHSSA